MSRPSLAELRQLLLTHRPRRACDGYPAHVRGAVIAALPALLEAGWKPTGLARELGLAGTTVSLWLQQPAPPKAFRPVTVVGRPPPSPSTLTLVTPNGFRVEGLDIDTLATLLVRLA